MRCDEFRVAVGAEPAATRTDIAAHARICAECAAYRHRLQALDRAIQAAVRPRVDTMTRPVWSIAAGLLLSVALAMSLWLSSTRPSFADELVAHAQHEPASLIHTLDVVPDAELAALLERDGLRLQRGVVRVSYASGCRFHGYSAPHLVVQTDHGPVTVLVLPHERARATPERIHASGVDGVIVPAPRGVLVALGPDMSVEGVARATLRALDYSPVTKQWARS
jgi:uncharacterized protein DUF3379